MPIHHYEPPINDKRTMTKKDWPGWYQWTIVRDGKLVAICQDVGNVRGIVRLVEDYHVEENAT